MWLMTVMKMLFLKKKKTKWSTRREKRKEKKIENKQVKNESTITKGRLRKEMMMMMRMTAIRR